jgi:cytosine/adenosine deaminase-related metal-dependent hydrolase
MTLDNPRNEVQVRNVRVEGEDLQESAQQFLGSLLRAGTSLALLPINVLPRETRTHIQNAGRELTLGVASLTKELAKTLENIAEDRPNRR